MMRPFLWYILLTSVGAATMTVTTNNGDVKGTSESNSGKTINIFKGIPYAKPPVGKLKFKNPEPVANWSPSVIDATSFQASCIQPLPLPTETESYRQPPTTFSEDCLYLNIWTPSTATNLAVLVFFHGGGFYMGSAAIGLYDGLFFVGRGNVLFVTVNYRLGAQGFSYLGSDTIPGNMGLSDQQMALQWIQDNIKYFGGDPTSVTIVGQEAGGASVGFHLLAPSSFDLYNTAVLMSGSPTASWASNDAYTARYNTKRLGQLFDCPTHHDEDLLKCLKKVNPQKLSDKIMEVHSKGLPFVPTVDGTFLKHHPQKLMMQGAFKNTTVLHGVVENEATLFLLPIVLESLGLPSPPPTITLTEEQYEKILTQILEKRKEHYNNESLSSFYVDGELPPGPSVDYFQALDLIWGDLEVKCPTREFAEYYSNVNDMYQYSFEYMISVSPYPSYVGAANSYELELFLGVAQHASNSFKNSEKLFGRALMRYLANFVKSGNPNSPSSVAVTWPLHVAEEKYLILKPGSGTAVSTALRQSQCNYLDNILPLIPIDGSTASKSFISGLILVVSMTFTILPQFIVA